MESHELTTEFLMIGTAANPKPTAPVLDALTLRVLTVNTHKGFSLFNRRFILHDLREAVREVGADVVFLQEVQGLHRAHSRRWANYPAAPHYEFLADQIWGDFAYGRNAVYPHGDHGNAVLSKFPIISYENRDISVHRPGAPRHAALRARSAAPAAASCMSCASTSACAKVIGGSQLELLQRHAAQRDARRRGGDRRRRFQRLAHAAPTRLLQRCGLQEVFHAANGASARSFPARFPVLQLDRIYVRNARRHRPINLHRHPWSRLSDHAPLAAEVTL